MKHGCKRQIRRALSLLLACAMLAGAPGLTTLAAESGSARAGTELKLWYDEPASQTVGGSNQTDIWQGGTLPIGNGDLGANVYGEIGTERLTLNEKTLWLGGPSENRSNYMGGNIVSNKGENGATIRAIQEKVFGITGSILPGDKTINNPNVEMLTGGLEFSNSGYGYYAPWGELRIATAGVTAATEGTYQRWLSLDNALAGVQFQSGGVTYQREYLASHPDGVLAMKLTASSSATFTISIDPSNETAGKSFLNETAGTFNNDAKYATVAEGTDTLKLCGALADNQLKFASYLKAVPGSGTTVAAAGGALTVTGTEVTLFFSAATDYANIFQNPETGANYYYRTGENDAALAERVQKTVNAAAGKGYNAVKTAHQADYKELYERVRLDLGQNASAKTTDALLSAYNAGTASESERRLLEVTLFQYGRYLTIASSREDSQLPSNLQGIWNNRTNPPWHADFHTNVNLQINYWPTYVTNLAECADPLVRYVDSLREPGRITATVYGGIEQNDSYDNGNGNGFMAHVQCTPYGWTCPGWNFVSWGWSPAAMPWILQNCWEYYEYTGDVTYMKNNIYPMMKEQVRLYEQLLVDINNDPNIVELATVPAYSPEHGPATAGNTFEQSLVWQLLEDTITAAQVLGVDADKIGNVNTPGTWRYIQSHLKGPIEVGTSGEVKEWYTEVGLNAGGYAVNANGGTMGDGYGHRHLSHMLGLFPGDLVQTNEEWIEAARVAMNNRTDESTGWGMSQRINTWARLRDGTRAYKLIGDLFRNGMYKNLWDAHPPFQIDGNFGYTSGVAEMLLQSNMGFIDLFPAMPDDWATGSYSGLVARGNFLLSAAWADGAATRVTITSKNGGECVVRYPNLARAVVKNGDSIIEFETIDNDKISFPTAKGETYTITDIPAEKISVVDDAEALRTDADSVTVRWSAKAGESYQVYRQVAGGELIAVGESVTTGVFVDDSSYAAMGDMNYFIAVNGNAPSAAIPVKDLRNMAGMIDDKDSRVTFSSGWGRWDGHPDDGNYNDTLAYITTPNGTETVSLTFYGTGIQVIGATNTDRGYLAIKIDDGDEVDCNTYATSSHHQALLYTEDGLTRGIHTIVVRAKGVAGTTGGTNKKVEIDAFKVLDTGSGGETPEELEISTVGNVEKLWNAGDTVQFTANLEGVTWSAASSVTHASTCDYPNHKFSWNADTQTLTAGLTDEVVTVTASKGGQTASKRIIITPKTTVTIVEDSVNGSTPNPAITWTGSWSSYDGESQKHHGGSKTENGTSYSYSFTGTGTAIFVQKNGHLSWSGNSYTVVLDRDKASEQTVTCSGYDSSLSTSGVNQQKLVEFLNLENTTHTVNVTASGLGRNLDFIEVYAPNPNAPQADLADLLDAVAEAAVYNEAGFTEESWAPLADALETAGNYLNNTVQATQEQADAAATAIRSAISGLTAKPLAAPTGLKAILVEGTAITLQWTAAEGATGYEVTVGTRKVEATATVCRVDGLESAEEYTFSVKSKNAGGLSTDAATLAVTTKDTVAPSKPAGLTWDGSTLTWTAATDNVAVTKYQVTVDGTPQDETGTSVALTLDATQQHTIQVIALDAAGNESVPAVLVVAPEYTVTVTKGTIAGGKSSFKAGEAVTVTANVPSGHIFNGWTATGVTLGDKSGDVTLSFSMPADNVTLTAATEAKNWPVTASLTNLTSNLPDGKEVAHGGSVSLTLTAADPYKLPATIVVTMGGEELKAGSQYTYNSANGALTIPDITGAVVITAENAIQTPKVDSFTAADPFLLPGAAGKTTKLEAEYMNPVPQGTGGSNTGVYVNNGPGFANKHMCSFLSGDKLRLYYNAPQAGRYTLTLHYRSGRDAGHPHTLGWTGDNVEDKVAEGLPSTLGHGAIATYENVEFDFIVTKAGPGLVEFTTTSVGDGMDWDWATFTLDAITVSGVTITGTGLEDGAATLYTNPGSGQAKSITLTANVEPADAPQTVTWDSDNDDIAHVETNPNGSATVTAGDSENGVAVITATAYGGVKATVTITVKTNLDGSVVIVTDGKDNTAVFDSAATVSLAALTPAGIGRYLEYQWQRDGTDISGAKQRTYTPVAADVGKTLTVTVTPIASGMGQDYAGSVTSDGVTVGKAAGPAIPAGTLSGTKPSEDEGTDGTITGLDTDVTYEYKGESDATWTAVTAGAATITGLSAGSYQVRVAETATHQAGPGRTVTVPAFGVDYFDITVEGPTHGTVDVTNQAAAEETVTLIVTPDTGYELDEDGVSVTADGEEVDVEAGSGEGQFTFEMPAADVTVTVTFVPKTFTIHHEMEHVTCSLGAAGEGHTHTITYGQAAEILLTPDEGYELPQTIMVIKESGGAFSGYEYDPVTGTLTFTHLIDEDVTISGTAEEIKYRIIHDLLNLSCSLTDHSVKHRAALEITLTPATDYRLPASKDAIVITMDGEELSAFTYENGVITIEAGVITGELKITAAGVSTVGAPLTGVTISGRVEVGQQLRAEVDPAGATVSYQWVRLDGAAETDIPGATGSRYLLTTADAGKTIKVKVTAVPPYTGTATSAATATVAAASVVPATGVSLEKTQETVLVGGSLTLAATVQPTNATNKMVRWSTGNAEVATVSESGLVTGVSTGTATITVTTVSGSHTAVCTVTVVNVMLDKTTATIAVGETETLTASVSADLNGEAFTWTSSNDSVASVDENGVVTGISNGTAVITVTTDSGETASCTVTVGTSASSSSGTTSRPKPTTTTTTSKNEDGSTTTTVTNNRTGTVTETTEKADGTVEVKETLKDGTVTETVKNTDGSTEVVETKPDGTVTAATTDPEGGKVEKVTDPEKNVAITVTDPEGEVLAEVKLPAVIPEPETKFEDVPEDHWAEKAINTVAGLGLVKGVGDDRYDMTTAMDRGSLATVLYRLSNGKSGYEAGFRDVPTGKYYTEGVAWAAKVGVVTGISADVFAPEQVITREQLAVMLARYAKLMGMDTKADAGALKSFADSSATGDWAVDGVAWCVKTGILRGKGGTVLDPTADVSRAEVAVMLERFVALMK